MLRGTGTILGICGGVGNCLFYDGSLQAAVSVSSTDGREQYLALAEDTDGPHGREFQGRHS